MRNRVRIGFAGVLIRREVIEQVGLLDEGFFMYFEDTDYCKRVRNAGGRDTVLANRDHRSFVGRELQVFVRKRFAESRTALFLKFRSRYFVKYYGHMGLLFANLAWLLVGASHFLESWK